MAGRIMAGAGAGAVGEGEGQGEEERVAVHLDGVREVKSIKRKNLNILQARRWWLGVGVGREELNGLDGIDPTMPIDLF